MRRRGRLARALAAVAAGVLGLGATGRPAALATLVPTVLADRLAVNLGTALVLSGQAVAVGDGRSMAAAAAALGRRLPDLIRVYALPTLREGAQGGAVRLAQARLAGLGDKLALDGRFGPATLAAVQAFNRRHGVRPVGVVGPATWRRLLGAQVAAAGRSAWALSAAYDTSPASLAAWNPGFGAPSAWARPVRGRLWVMPPDVRPSARLLGTGSAPTANARATPAPAPAAAAATRSDGTAGATRTAMVVLAVAPGTPTAAIEAFAAWLGGRSVRATVVLTPSALAGQGATALALEGEDVGAQVGPGTDAAALMAAAARAAVATGERPAVAYAGLYPSAGSAAMAARAGLAVVVGGELVTRATVPRAGAVYVLSGSPARLERTLAPLVRAADDARESVAGVRVALRLSVSG